MAGVLKKGVLCLAFAAAISGLAGCEKKPAPAPGSEQDANYDTPVDKLTASGKHLHSAVMQAVVMQVRNENLDRALKDKKITQKDHDDAETFDNQQIAQLRGQYAGTKTLPYFDGWFKHELVKEGFVPPAKLPENPAAAPTTAPTTKPAAKGAAGPPPGPGK